MKEFILNNLGNIIVIVMLLIAGVVLFVKDKRNFYKLLRYLVTVAEKQITEKGAGAKKLEQVFDMAYALLPPLLQLFISKQILINWIEIALKQAKEEWARYDELDEIKMVIGND